MRQNTNQIDLVKLALYMLKRAWLLLLCGVIGFAGMYMYATAHKRETYTASGTMYVYNGNPNMVNYQYASISDLNSAVQLLDTYMVVVRSNKVMDAVAERLSAEYPGIQTSYIAGTLSMGSVSETGVLRVRCVTDAAQKSADICNAVLDVAPAEIIRVVNAGGIEIIDYAEAPLQPDAFSPRRQALMGALIGVAAAGGLLLVLFLLNNKVADAKELNECYTPPVLSSIRRVKEESKNPGKFLLRADSSMEITENYAKLRMNLLYTLVGKEKQVVTVTSAISGEGKSTISANLAISCALSGKRVLLVDADMRRACQRDIFRYRHRHSGLSNVLAGQCAWQETVINTEWDNLQILPAGQIPPNPAELLDSSNMQQLLDELSQQYDLVLLDVPPINIVSDPLALSSHCAGCLVVVRQNFTDHRELRKALIAAEMTGMNVLGFVFYGEKIHSSSYYSRKYYNDYYHKYDTQAQRNAETQNKATQGGQ